MNTNGEPADGVGGGTKGGQGWVVREQNQDI